MQARGQVEGKGEEVETEMNDMVGKEQIEAGEGVGRGTGSFGGEEGGAGASREPVKTSLTLC